MAEYQTVMSVGALLFYSLSDAWVLSSPSNATSDGATWGGGSASASIARRGSMSSARSSNLQDATNESANDESDLGSEGEEASWCDEHSAHSCCWHAPEHRMHATP